MPDRWKIWVDTGGTFTDCIAVDPGGGRHHAKVLSTSVVRARVIETSPPDRVRIAPSPPLAIDVLSGGRLRRTGRAGGITVTHFDPTTGWVTLEGVTPAGVDAGTGVEIATGVPAPRLAAHLVSSTPIDTPLPMSAMRLATTRGTNALLERRGAATALFITGGFGDLLAIGDQRRPDLFALRIDRPPPLPAAVVEVPERLGPDGRVEHRLDVGVVIEEAKRLRERGIEAAAIALMHSDLNPEHERTLAATLRELGFRTVVTSSEAASFVRLLPRAETAALDAYLGPAIRAYLDAVSDALSGGTLHVLTSAGGLVGAAHYRPRDSLLSGPAGGVAGAVDAARVAGFDRIIGLDMGGTSTDVFRFGGAYEYQFEHSVGGVRVLAPALAIETVAAGGGSICGQRAGGLEVGPQSAGADPGPACYGAGGPLTLTDVNLLLGRLDPARFTIPVDPAPARAALERLVDDLARERGRPIDADHVLAGLLAIGDERMASAIARVSEQRGHDPAAFTLVAFGGAGPQHACAVAERLGIATVVVPADAALLSAAGLGTARIERIEQRQILAPLDEVEAALTGHFATLVEQGAAAIAAEGVVGTPRVVRRLASLRVAGQDQGVLVEADDLARLREAFRETYERRFGHAPAGAPIEVESIRVVVAAGEEAKGSPPATGNAPGGTTPDGEVFTRAFFDGARRTVPVHDRAALSPDRAIRGPCLVVEPRSVLVLPPAWEGRRDGTGAIVARRAPPASRAVGRPGAGAVAAEELFAHRLTTLAAEAGDRLQRTALSTNVKERLDFSCAILDAAGTLIVNAPHIPVHLGALGRCVRAVLETTSLGPGDVVLTNHPAWGGSHLPDLTVITPIDGADGGRLGFAACRAHHADIGGVRPGSMPPDATNLAAEGVVIPPTLLVQNGIDRLDAVESSLRASSHPPRMIAENIADLRAQIASNQHAVHGLRRLAVELGSSAVADHMRAITDRAERLLRRAIAARPDGVHHTSSALDDGSPLCVRVEVAGETLVIDFAGTGGRHPGNLNAPVAVVASAVVYVARLLVGAEVPLNEGLLRAIDLRIPPCFLNPEFTGDAERDPAVVGGNVETSQRVVEVLLDALGLCAASQGTMNNVLFGTDRFAYYETVGGGAGAGPGFNGADAVHTHMTNTRITDAELLERRAPVRIETFAIRRGSGGAGHHPGGNGIVRCYRFTAPLEVSILSQHRTSGPPGAAGGGPGAPGRQWIERAGGGREPLPACAGCRVEPGDRLWLLTPGGGGWGSVVTL